MKTRTHPNHSRQGVRRPSRIPVCRRRKTTWGRHAFYWRITAETRRDWRNFRLTLRPGLERDTQLMPWLIAESVCAEGSRYLGIELPARYAAWLEIRAEVSYARFSHFRKLMRGRGDAPRGWLRTYMRHWLAGLLGVERPDLYECLPESFALGHPLPPAVHPRRRWHGNRRPLHPPRDWNPQRVIEHRRWRWLAKRLPARTAAERTTLENAATATEREIDALVYELYGLVPEEIALVDAPPQMSRPAKAQREAKPQKQARNPPHPRKAHQVHARRAGGFRPLRIQALARQGLPESPDSHHRRLLEQHGAHGHPRRR